MKTNFSRAKRRKNRRVFAIPAIFGLICVFFGACYASAQGSAANANIPSHESERAAQVRASNNSILQLHGQAQRDSSTAASLANEAAAVLTQRAAALQGLIQENPRAALSFAFSPDLLADLAAKFPDAASQLEAHITLSGPIEHWTFDGVDLRNSRSEFRMKVGKHTFNLHFAGPEPNLAKDMVFQVTGVVLGNDVAVSESTTLPPGPAGVPASSSGSVILHDASSFVHECRWTNLLSVLCLALLSLSLARKSRPTGKHVHQFATYAIAAVVIASNPAMSSAQTSACSTMGVQKTLVLLVSLPNASLPTAVSKAAMQDVFFAANTPGISLDGFLREASSGQASATGDVFGPFNLSGTYASCSDLSGAVITDAITAAQNSGVNVGNYTRLFLIFPDAFNCGWQGYASSGCSIITTSGTVYNLSQAYISAAYATPRSSGVQLASHEMGHNLGLWHSGKLNSTVGTDVIGPISSPGTESDLGDYWTTMGESLGLYTAPQNAEAIGWMKSPANFQTVTASGTYTLQPLETSPAGLQALKIQRGTGNPGNYLWVEYRQPLGDYDSTLMTQPYSGALIHYEDAAQVGGTAHSYLPNFTASDASGFSSALAVGQTWTDNYTNLSLSVQSATPSGLTISVSFGATPCVSSAPSVTVSPLNPSIYPGQSANYAASVKNNDSAACPSSTIGLSSSEPSGWPTAFSSSSLTLSPGQSASLTLSKSAPSGTPAGTYAVNLNAADNSTSGTGMANATVVTPPSMAINISVSGTNFARPGTVSVAATVTNGGVPASGASVTFAVTTPTGGTTTQSATSSSSGTATWNYKLNQRSPSGTYSITAQAALSSGSKKLATTQSATSNTISFAVQ